MRIPFTAAISLFIVGVLKFLDWTTSNLYQTLVTLFKVAPGVTWLGCMIPAVLGCVALWRVFKLMERPAQMLTLAHGASALSHHQRERKAALRASACFAVTAVLLTMLNSGEAATPVLVSCGVVFVYCSLVLAVALLVLATLRVRKVTRFVQRNPIFG